MRKETGESSTRLQSVASAKCAKCRPLGHAANSPERSRATPVFIHTYGRGVRWSPGMRPTFILHTQQAWKAEEQERCVLKMPTWQIAQQLKSASFTYTLYDNSTKQPPSKIISQLANNFTSLFFLFKPEGSFRIHTSPEPEYHSRCSYKTMGWTAQVSYFGRGRSLFCSPKRPIQSVPVFPHW